MHASHQAPGSAKRLDEAWPRELSEEEMAKRAHDAWDSEALLYSIEPLEGKKKKLEIAKRADDAWPASGCEELAEKKKLDMAKRAHDAWPAWDSEELFYPIEPSGGKEKKLEMAKRADDAWPREELLYDAWPAWDSEELAMKKKLEMMRRSQDADAWPAWDSKELFYEVEEFEARDKLEMARRAHDARPLSPDGWESDDSEEKPSEAEKKFKTTRRVSEASPGDLSDDAWPAAEESFQDPESEKGKEMSQDGPQDPMIARLQANLDRVTRDFEEFTISTAKRFKKMEKSLEAASQAPELTDDLTQQLHQKDLLIQELQKKCSNLFRDGKTAWLLAKRLQTEKEAELTAKLLKKQQNFKMLQQQYIASGDIVKRALKFRDDRIEDLQERLQESKELTRLLIEESAEDDQILKEQLTVRADETARYERMLQERQKMIWGLNGQLKKANEDLIHKDQELKNKEKRVRELEQIVGEMEAKIAGFYN